MTCGLPQSDWPVTSTLCLKVCVSQGRVDLPQRPTHYGELAPDHSAALPFQRASTPDTACISACFSSDLGSCRSPRLLVRINPPRPHPPPKLQLSPRSCFLPIRSAHSPTPPKKDQQVALSISFPTKPPEHRGFARQPPVKNFQKCLRPQPRSRPSTQTTRKPNAGPSGPF